METPSGKVLTKPPVANFGSVLAIMQTKRRKLGSRAIGRIWHLNQPKSVCRRFYSVESNICVIVTVRFHTALRCWNASHVTQGQCANWGEPVASISDVGHQ